MVFTVLSGLLLKFWTVDIHLISVKQQRLDYQASGAKEVIRKQDNGEKNFRKVDVDLIDYALWIYKPSLLGPGIKLEILKGIVTRFEAGELNVIMGREFFRLIYTIQPIAQSDI